MRNVIAAAAVLLALSSGAADWSQDIVSFSAVRGDSPLPAGATLKSGDRLTVALTPPDEPESLGVTFFITPKPTKQNKRPPARVVEFDGMPLRFAKDRDANVWRLSFAVPALERTEEVAKGGFSIAVLRYGADTHFDGQTAFAVPYALAIDEERTGAAKTSLLVYDFGPEDAAVLRGATAVSRKSTPEGFKWIGRPTRWEKAKFFNLDALMHDWAEREGGTGPLSFRLALPAGKWKVAAGFGGFGQMCWNNGPHQPAQFVFSVNGRPVYSRRGDEKERFAFREHEAEPGEDIYATYVLPVLPETRLDVETDGNGVEFALDGAPKGKKLSIDYLAAWPANDAAAEERFNAILERRRARFNSITREVPAADHYGLGRGYAEAKARMAADVPFLKALVNPFDWTMPETDPPATDDALVVRAARGEKLCGAFVYRSDRDAPAVSAVAKGFPAWAKPTVWKLMNYRFTNGYRNQHYIAPNHLMPGPRPVRKGLNYTWYVRFDVPKDAAPGSYRGTVEVLDGTTVRTLPAELVVYDATLPDLDDYRIGLMGAGDGTKEQMIFAKNELGATTVHLSNGRLGGAKLVRDKDGRIVGCANIGWCSVEDLDRRFKTYAEVGFPCKVPYCGPSIIDRHDAYPIEGMKPFTPEWTEGLKVVLKTILAVARSNGCESVSMDLGGELGHDAHRPDPDAVKAVVRFLKLAKELEPGIEYTWRCNCMDSTTNFYPLLDYACIRGRSWQWVDRESDFGKKKRIGVYSQGGRFMNGVSAWYHGAKGSFREWVAWGHALEFNEFLCQGACGCAGHIEGMLGPKAEGGFTLTQRGEAWRAGIDDIRYLKFLENAIAAAPEGKPRAAAEKFLAFVHDAVRNSWSFCRFCALGGPGRQDGGNDWPYLRIDLVRDLCVRQALALAAGTAANLPAFPALEKVDARTYLALDDGPLGRAGDPKIPGQVLIPKELLHQKAELVLSGEGLEPVTLALVPPGLKTRQLYYMPNGKQKVFAVDASRLGPGTYDLVLRLGGAETSRTTLTLVSLR